MDEEQKTEVVEEKDENRSVYEFAYLLVPTIGEDDLSARFTAIKDLIVSFGATPISEEHPKMMPLAYEMQYAHAGKSAYFAEAYFGWFKFDLTPASATEIERAFARYEGMIRFLLIKTVRESTLAPKKMFVRSDVARKRYTPKKEEAEGAPIDEEKLDKEIDALIAPEETTEAAPAVATEVVE